MLSVWILYEGGADIAATMPAAACVVGTITAPIFLLTDAAAVCVPPAAATVFAVRVIMVASIIHAGVPGGAYAAHAIAAGLLSQLIAARIRGNGWLDSVALVSLVPPPAATVCAVRIRIIVLRVGVLSNLRWMKCWELLLLGRLAPLMM